MCTLSIFNNKDEIIVTMNRDEHRQREEENRLILNHKNSSKIKIVYPVDKLAGGSWFGGNEHGVVLALLNRYQDSVSENKATRGEIIPLLLGCEDITHILSQLDTLNTRRYNPFDLIIVTSNSSYCFSWNGESTQLTALDLEKPYFISSSSVDREAVLSWRQRFFSRLIKEKYPDKISAVQILKNIHLQQLKTDKSKSIFMSRDHSHTKSICQARISRTDLNFIYYPQKSLKKLRQSEITDDFQTIILKMTP